MKKMILNTEYNRKQIIQVILSVAILLFVYLWQIKDLTHAAILNDEFGYWGIAASLTGTDWSDLLHATPYYSYGYSLLLVPLFWMNISSALMYQIGIILNTCFVLASFFLCISCGKKMFPDIRFECLVTLSLTVNLYTNTIVMAKVNWSETLLYLMFWVIFWWMLKILENPKIINIICFIISNFYLYAIHQRCIGVLIASALFLLVLCLVKHFKLRDIIIMLFCAAILFTLHSIFKTYIQEHIFVTESMIEINDYSGQIENIKYLFGSLEGFKCLLKSICGKLFYLGTATFMVALTCAWDTLLQTIYCCKQFFTEKNFDNKFFQNMSGFFLFLSFGGTFLINSISMNNADARLDVLVYGRYMEFAIGPVLLIGIIVFLEKASMYLTELEAILILVLSGIVNNVLMKVPVSDFNGICSTTFYYFFQERSQVDVAYFIAHVIIIFGFIIAFINIIQRKFKITTIEVLPCLLLACGWLFLSNNDMIYGYQQVYERSLYSIEEAIDYLGDDKNVYYLEDDTIQDPFYISLKFFQHRFKDMHVSIINSIEEIPKEDWNDCYVITDYNYTSTEQLMKTHKLITLSRRLCLYGNY